MAMILNNILIGSVEMLRTEWLRPGTTFEALWLAAEDGALEEFEETALQQASGAPAQALARELLRCLRVLDGRETASCPLLPQGSSRPIGFAQALAGYDPLPARLGLAARGAATLEELAGCRADWPDRCGWILYLFLLLHCQVLPREPLRPENTGALRRILTELPAANDARPAVQQSKLAISANGFLRCSGRTVWLRKNGRWESVWQDEQDLAGLCCLNERELIVLRADGTLAPCTPAPVRAAAQGCRLIQTEARGGHFVLLCEDGTVRSDLPLPDWNGLQRVTMGLNSACGIRGAVARGVVWNGADRITELTDLVFADTHTYDGETHYVALRKGGELYTDCGHNRSPLTHVDAAALSVHGAVYAREGTLYLHRFGAAAPTLLKTLPPDFVVEELHCRDDRILCGSAEKPFAAAIL